MGKAFEAPVRIAWMSFYDLFSLFQSTFRKKSYVVEVNGSKYLWIERVQCNDGNCTFLSNPSKYYQGGAFWKTECQVTGLTKFMVIYSCISYSIEVWSTIRLTTHRWRIRTQQSPHVVPCLDYFGVDSCSTPVLLCQLPIRLRGRRRSWPGWPKSGKSRRRKLRLRQLWWCRRRWWHQGPASTNPRSHGTVPEKTCRNHQIIERIKAGLFFIPADIASK